VPHPSVEEACRVIASKHPSVQPTAGLILGSGLGGLGEHIENATTIPYEEIPGFPVSRVFGHSGNLILGYLGTCPVVAMQGRAHLYEGWSIDQATFPVRCMHALGIDTLIVSNASGGINPRYHSGQVVLIDDHIDWLHHPSQYATESDKQTSFLNSDVPARRSPPYDSELLEIAERIAIKLGFSLARGTYLATLGPNYETRSEYRMFAKMGADMVGMSTVPEVILANQLGLKVLAFSIVTNVATPDVQTVTDHKDVLDWSRRAQSQLVPLIDRLLQEWNNDD
jgi:purine-nucleoside phosphorylase